MITGWKHKGLKELFERGATRRIEQKRWARCLEILTVINTAASARDVAKPGFFWHDLAPDRPSTYATRAWGPWRITFRFQNGVAFDVDLEQYHDRY